MKIRNITAAILSLTCGVGVCNTALAEFTTTQPFDAITYRAIITENPRREIHIAIIDLSNKDLSIRVTRGGDDPDGDGPCKTTLMKPSAIANREDFVLAVNGDFFGASKVKDAEGSKSGYVSGIGAWPIGPAVTDGKVWQVPDKPRPTLAIGANNHVKLVDLKDPPADVMQAVAGNQWLIKDGASVAPTTGAMATTPHPRTAVGLTKSGNKLVIAVIDGRRKDATGMPYADLTNLMREQGCENAINLDGGGSSEMVLRDPQTGILHVVNNPSDKRERSVANVLGISVKGAKQSEDVVLDRVPTTQKAQ